jgi:hypothetical protein
LFFQIRLAICTSVSLYGIKIYLALRYNVCTIRPVCTHSLGLRRKVSCGLAEKDTIGFDFLPPKSIKFFIIPFYVGTYAHFARWKLALFFQLPYRGTQYAEREYWLHSTLLSTSLFFQIRLGICTSKPLYGINGYLALGYSVCIIRPVCTHSLGLRRKVSCGSRRTTQLALIFCRLKV